MPVTLYVDRDQLGVLQNVENVANYIRRILPHEEQIVVASCDGRGHSIVFRPSLEMMDTTITINDYDWHSLERRVMSNEVYNAIRGLYSSFAFYGLI